MIHSNDAALLHCYRSVEYSDLKYSWN